MSRTPAHASWRLARAAGLLALASGCAAVRPVSDAPTLPTPAAYVAAATPAARAEREADGARTPDATLASPSLPDRPTTPESGANPAGEPSGAPWWTAFADPALDATIQEALRKNYFIRDLRNLIYENELDPLMPNSPLWPLKIGLPATLQHVTAALPPAPQVGKTPAAPAYGLSFAEADVGISASYQLDVFGQLDVQRRILEDQVQLQKMNTEAFAHTLADQVAQLWFDILEQRELQKLLEEQIRYSDELLSIVKARFEQHLAPRLAVLQQEQLLLNTQAQVPLVAAQLALLNSKLTLLLGRTPNPDMELVPYDRKLPDLPPAPAIGSPADLFRNSPDVRVAQARSAEGEHLLSQNLASWLPVVEVIGAAGAQTFDFNSKFFTSALGIRLTYPVFDGGQRITKGQLLEYTVERRNWQYALAVNTAIQKVQDALVQERKQADNLTMIRAEVELGRRVLTEARQLFERGLSDYLPVLNALTNVISLERSSLQAQRLLLMYRIQLYHALGGTWSRAATKL